MFSLRTRLLLATSLTLAVFLVFGSLSLNRAFEASAQQSQMERMQAITYALLGAAEPNEYGVLSFADSKMPDLRLQQPQSGLEAALFGDTAGLLWGSPSLADDIPTPANQPVGEWRFEQLPGRFVLLFGLSYASGSDTPRPYTLMLAENSALYDAQMRAYRRTLFTWLGGGAVVLLLLQGAVMRWSLRPLRALVRELADIEAGERERIEGRYPTELQPLTEGLNAMIVNERSQQSRYRNALGDLAHSLKTPLAVLHGIAERPQADSQKLLAEQVGRMGHIVQHQLKRAATVGSRTLAEPTAIRPLVEKISGALVKVYHSRRIAFDIDVAESLRLRADAGDLYELIGNLLDNACKYGESRVRFAARRDKREVLLTVEDDGPGFPEDTSHLLERGIRADTRQEGQGLGLGAVKDIVEAYQGQLLLEKSALGGGRVVVRFVA